jgi:imidazolonepropionase-like amidohydrolase
LGARSLALALGVLSILSTVLAAAWGTIGPQGPSDFGSGQYPAAYAITSARIVAAPGKVYEPGTIVVRRGIIESVGLARDVRVPYDAETIDGNGLWVYPGFIDLYTTAGQRAGVERSATGKGRPVDLSEAPLVWTPPDNRRGLTPEFEVASVLELTDSFAEPRRRLGFTDLLCAPAGAIATGQSVLASLSGLPRREVIVAAPVALHVNLAPPIEPAAGPATPPQPGPAPGPGPGPGPARRRGFFLQEGRGENPYPRALMGSVAHLRQAMLDSDHLQKLEAYYRAHGGSPPPFDPTLKALQATRSGQLPVWWEANTRDEIHRALDLASEFGTSVVIVGGSEAAKVAGRLKEQHVAVVMRLRFPEEPRVPAAEEYRKRPPGERAEPLHVLDQRKRRWQEQVATAGVLAREGVRYAFATDGVERIESFPSILRQLVTAGLTPEAALAGLTRNAAAIAGVERRLGTLEPDKLGHVIAFSAPFSEESGSVKFVLIDGLKFEIKPAERARTKGRPAGGPERSATASARAGTEPTPKARGSAAQREPRSPQARQPAEENKAGQIRSVPEGKAGRAAPGKDSDKRAGSRVGADGARSKLDGGWPGGEQKAAALERPKGGAPDTGAQHAAGAKIAVAKQAAGADSKTHPKRSDVSKPQSQSPRPPKPAASFVDVASELDEDRKPSFQTGGNVVIQGATILTVTRGTIERGSILVRGGKINYVGPRVPAPRDVKVINADGLVALPGIIDTHSHIAAQGGLNEASLSVVPEVRVKDVVTGDDIAIYRALAGGTTTARLLHGSANTIGGQDAVIKLRYGKPARELIVRDAPQGVKFALGENVTRARGRFPNTRMGVESVIARAFDAGKSYHSRWAQYAEELKTKNASEVGPPPRLDLRLEALANILDGSIKIHSHCYRSDEILMLLGTAQEYGIKVRSLQHALEGYKVAAEIAAHGASTSTFSDWWAYKIEAYDAIPFNAALLTEAGASVCIKSDDAELMRHLNLEAAKMVKYGAVSEAQALAMITLNPARQLGLEDRLGSIEAGKDADIVLFSGHPLDAFSRCELALIDGEIFFERRAPGGGKAQRPVRSAAMPAASEPARHRTIEIAAQPKNIFALVGANLHPVSGPEIKGGTLVVAGGKITALGPTGIPIPPDAQTIELSGLDVWPGMVDAGSTLGLSEVGSLTETQDFADAAQFQPELRSASALHADSEHIPVSRANGILTCLVEPSGGIISGQACLIDLNGWVPRDLVIADRVALNLTIPPFVPRAPDSQRLVRGRPGMFPGQGQSPGGPDPVERRKETIERIKDLFRRAAAYDQVVKTSRQRQETPPVPDPRLEAILPYACGSKPVVLHADQPVEILDALALARELKLKAVISGASEAWKVADALRESKIPVLVGGTLRLPRHDYDPYDAVYSNPAKLHAAGVTLAIRSQAGGPGSATAVRNLPYEAATAVAFGLPEDVALQSVTVIPARILGVADQLGSLEAGKRANLVVTAGHLLQPTTPVLALFIDGQPLRPESRHTQLYAKYQRRLDEIRSGRARLGIELPATAVTGTAPTPGPAPATAASPDQRAAARRE